MGLRSYDSDIPEGEEVITLISCIMLFCVIMLTASLIVSVKDKNDETKQNRVEYFKRQAK